MVDYTSLIAAWNSNELPSGIVGIPLTSEMTIDQKLAAINGWKIPGPDVDVPVSKIAGYLMRTGKWIQLATFATSPPEGANPIAIAGAKMLTQICSNQSPITTFEMSDSTTASQIRAMLTAIIEENTPGLTLNDQNTILAYAAGPLQEWWLSVHLLSPPNVNDLVAAGLI